MSSRFITAKISVKSDHALYGNFEPLPSDPISHHGRPSRKGLERTKVGWCMQVAGCWLAEARLHGHPVEGYEDIQSLHRS